MTTLTAGADDQLTSAAVRIVSLPGRRRVAVFAYEQGARLFGLDAPARRASCLELFEAALRWAVSR
jgi:hypothetical protein